VWGGGGGRGDSVPTQCVAKNYFSSMASTFFSSSYNFFLF
jgi:hypothetical protein